MSRAWVLPEHFADVLPAGAAHVERLRRDLLDLAGQRGFELVIPPLLEHLDSLLSGTGREIDLQTFKLVDQTSGRLLGLRADTTPQVARVDAHLLNRLGVVRLCYCGPVVHAVAVETSRSRELLQFGAEIFGHGGIESEFEVLELALDAVSKACSGRLTLDLADARLLRGVLSGVMLDPDSLQELAAAVSHKDPTLLAGLRTTLDSKTHEALHALLGLYGDVTVLARAAECLPPRDLVRRALDDLQRLGRHLSESYPEVTLSFDLADMGGYGYYSGMRFAIYGSGASNALARGGRYDEVGAIFGRNRPAVGFSTDVKALAAIGSPAEPVGAVKVRWSEDPGMRAAVRQLREAGQTVVVDLPNAPSGECGLPFDRILEQVSGRWVLRAL
jgi:ATP phosphoribosyltransferase regulatory subunit